MNKLIPHWRTVCLIQFTVLLCLYTYLGLAPHPTGSLPLFNDKLMHATGYFFAAFSISFAFPAWRYLMRGLFLVVYGIAIEIGQHFMPPRTFDFYDICANTTGVILGLVFVSLVGNWIYKHWRFQLFI